MNDDAFFFTTITADRDLNLGVRIHADIEHFAMPGEPGIGPTAVITYTDRRYAVDNTFNFCFSFVLIHIRH